MDQRSKRAEQRTLSPMKCYRPPDRSNRRGGAKRILLAVFANEFSRESLWRAHSLCVVLDAELHVVRVIRSRPNARYAFCRVQREAVIGALTGMLEARRATRVWLTAVLGHALPKGRLKLRGGEFFAEVSKRATELEATLIVVSPGADRDGRRITRLARHVCTPVLVARTASTQAAVVAATDLSDGSAAVLQRASALCQRLDAPLVAVHNLAPMPVPVGPEPVVHVALPTPRDVEDRRRRALEEAMQTLPWISEAVLTTESNSAEAILKEAKIRDADLIVVGSRRRGWVGRLMRRSVSAQVVNRAVRSVLVTPLARQRDEARGTRPSERLRSQSGEVWSFRLLTRVGVVSLAGAESSPRREAVA